jgi:hypothetical protein
MGARYVELFSQFDEKFGQYIPSQGPAESLFGEIIRAISRIGYRYYNDGDKFNDGGYGTETAAPSVVYLCDEEQIPHDLRMFFNNTFHDKTSLNEEYEEMLFTLADFILSMDEAEIQKLVDTPNRGDSRDKGWYEVAAQEYPSYDDEEEDDYYEEEDDYEDDEFDEDEDA